MAGYKKIIPGRSLAEVAPEIAAQWHPTKNGGVTPADVFAVSQKKIWWKCDVADDHEWSTSVGNRFNGHGCPCCSGRKVSTTNSLASLFPKIAAEWHPTKNGELTPESVIAGSHKKVWWKCEVADDHEWEATLINRTFHKRGCPCCANRKISTTNSLVTINPEVASQWHPTKNSTLIPELVIAGSHKKAWWKCEVADDHEWEAQIKSRAFGGHGCSCCAGLKASITNSVGSLFPEVAAQWHPTKNGELTPNDVVSGSERKYWWKCEVADDHEWEAMPYSRTHGGTGCACCAGLKVSVTNSLDSLYPEIAAQWHPTKNGELTPNDVVYGSEKRIWWKCDVADDHEWQRTPNGRTFKNSGCPTCTLTPRSAQEMRLAHELSALINFDLEKHKIRFGGRLRDVDMMIDDLNLVIEFDGSWWHRNKAEQDRKKTALLEEAGWTVIRVRERPGESIHINDVMVDTNAPVKLVANETLLKIVEVTGVEIPTLQQYLESEEPWRDAEALVAIRKFHVERAAKKAKKNS